MPDLLEHLAAALADRYAVESEVGRGGMAVVFLAEDLKHRRKVAVKVLSPNLASEVATERFLREIEIAAGLTHPHILPLHDSGQADGLLFCVMPYIEGESLRERLRRETQLPLEDALQITREVAEALNCAHERGIVHRDIKPANILLEHGHALIADFGIARVVEQVGSDGITKTGLAMGTPAYMSPEQASGSSDVDGRADIYALGCVLYEMLSGEAPYTGPTPQAVLAKKRSEPTPRISVVRDTVPPTVEAALIRALAKIPADRFDNAGEFAAALEATGASAPGAPVPAAPMRRRTRVIIAIVAAFLGAASILVAISSRDPAVQLSATIPVHKQLTFIGDVRWSAISPDGRFLAYISDSQLFVQEVDGGQPLRLGATGNTFSLEWSPDGARILFSGFLEQAFGTYLVPLLGGQPERLSWYRPRVTWSTDGTRAFAHQPTGSPVVADLYDDQLKEIDLGTPFLRLHGGDWSPAADLVAVTAETPDGYSLWVVGLSDGTRRLVLKDSIALNSGRWSAGGDALYYLRGRDDLGKISWDLQSGEPGDTARTLATGLQVMPQREHSVSFSVTDDNQRLVYTKQLSHSNLWLVPFEDAGNQAAREQLTTGTAMTWGASLSPNGDELAYLRDGVEGTRIHRMPLNGGTPTQITTSARVGLSVVAAHHTMALAWSPDGQSLAFGAEDGGATRVARLSSNGGAARVFENTVTSGVVSWHPGEKILFQLPGNDNIGVLDPETGFTSNLFSEPQDWVSFPRYSPDGERVALSILRDGRLMTGILSLADSTEFLMAGSYPIGWTKDGAAVLALSQTGQIVISGPTGVDSISADLSGCQVGAVLLSAQQVLCQVTETTSDVWMIEDFDPHVN